MIGRHPGRLGGLPECREGCEVLLESRETSVWPREVGKPGRAGKRQKDLPCSGSTSRAEDAQIDNFRCNESDLVTLLVDQNTALP